MRWFTALAVALLIAWHAPARAADDAVVRAEIERAEAAWNKAIIDKDPAAAAPWMDPAYALVGDDPARNVERAVWLANLPRMAIKSYSFRVVDLRVSGDVAVATLVGEWSVQRGDKLLPDSFVLSDVWVKRDGAWRVLQRIRRNPPGAGSALRSMPPR